MPPLETTTMKMAPIHLVVPCFHESSRIGAFLPELCAQMDALGGVCVVVVEDGSSPEEQARMTTLIDGWRKRYACLRPGLLLAKNVGKGGAVYEGWRNAVGADWLGFVDADGSCPPDEVARLIRLAREQATPQVALIASRIRMLGRKVHRDLKRHIMGRIYADLVAELMHIPLHDSQCGLKLIPAAAYADIEPRLHLKGFAFDVELLASLLDAGWTVEEIPIDWFEVPGGKIKLLRDSLRMARDLWEVHYRRTHRDGKWVRRRILVLNQFVPPEQPPTARLAGELVEALRVAGHDAQCIGAGSGYGAVRGVRRLLRDLAAHLKIAWRVLFSGPCDWIVCLSDPTGLPVTARMVASLKGARLAHWAMDVYPQVAIALGAVRPGLISEVIGRAMGLAYRNCDLLVALDADMAAELQRVSGREAKVLPPWPPAVPAAAAGAEAEIEAVPATRRWLYSGNLGRAHDFETLLQAQKILEAEDALWELHFQGGGPGRRMAEERAAQLGLQRCYWSGYVPDDQLVAGLLEADVLVATQKPETRGLLWPSKLALMKHLGVPIAWVGPAEGAVAESLRDLEVPVGIVEPGQAEALAGWLRQLPPRSPRRALNVIHHSVDQERHAGFGWWLRQLAVAILDPSLASTQTPSEK